MLCTPCGNQILGFEISKGSADLIVQRDLGLRLSHRLHKSRMKEIFWVGGEICGVMMWLTAVSELLRFREPVNRKCEFKIVLINEIVGTYVFILAITP